MRKRNPDSLSNLIHANRLSDDMIEEKKEQLRLINDLKEELAGTIYATFYIVKKHIFFL